MLCHREREISYRFVEKLAYLHYTILLLAAILLLAFRWNRRSVHKTRARAHTHTHTHTHPFNGAFSGTTRVSQYQNGKTNRDFTGARDSEWQWRQLGHMQVCTSLQTDNHASTAPLSFLQAGCPSCRPINSVKALKALTYIHTYTQIYIAPKIVRTNLRRWHRMTKIGEYLAKLKART